MPIDPHSSPPPPPGPAPDSIAAMAPLCAIFRRHLKSLNLKYTPERAGILDAIIERDAIFEVDELLVDLRTRGVRVSKATVYRTMKLLQDAGIISQVLFDSKQTHYQLAYGQGARDHMVCVRSGKYIEFVAPELTALRERLATEHGWSAVGHRFQIYAVSPESAPE